MFTGIVEGTRRIVAAFDAAAGRRISLRLDPPLLGEPIALGESIALDGVCLTVAAFDADVADFDAIPETLGLTTLGRRRAGDRVNVERALRMGDRLGGHFVQGHVDGIATLDTYRETGGAVELTFRAESKLIEQMVLKGSIAIDGVSLTLATVDAAASTFSVALIPATLALTTLADRRPGDAVNIETDLIGKWVRRYVQPHHSTSGLTMEKLRDAGWTT